MTSPDLLSDVRLVAVGSTNRVKIGAVRGCVDCVGRSSIAPLRSMFDGLNAPWIMRQRSSWPCLTWSPSTMSPSLQERMVPRPRKTPSPTVSRSRYSPGVEKPAVVTVFHNGVVVHHATPFWGPTRHRSVLPYTREMASGPIALQDHGNPVRYRNIWVRELKEYDQPVAR